MSFKKIPKIDSFYLLEYYADLQNPNSLANKLRLKYEKHTLSQFFNYLADGK